MTAIRTATPDPRSPQPKGNAWSLLSCLNIHGEIVHRWGNGDVMVCASRHEWYEPNKAGLVVHKAQGHVSVSVGGRRATDDEIRSVLADFGFEGSEEDNHSSGLARHFWLDEGVITQPECECKATEETVVEPDGYRWQRVKGAH